MWGYIASFKFLKPASNVPSLYVRVYRIKMHYFLRMTRSLIICEGISRKSKSNLAASSFPHYMWGYIVPENISFSSGVVPSLYVRVYRYSFTAVGLQVSSLIICEGISMIREMMEYIRVFPHYMWGYIAIYQILRRSLCVPSLYVRVYLCAHKWNTYSARSLIICEGISLWPLTIMVSKSFPHYMWGYIGALYQS